MSKRIENIYRPVEERKGDFSDVEIRLTESQAAEQTERCRNCAIPFCFGAGCPLGNAIPEINRAVCGGRFEEAYRIFSLTSPFPEFTGLICPALCEASCVRQLDEAAVMIRQMEKTVIEKAFSEGWVQPQPPARENGRSVAVVGAGPAGLACAHGLRRRGFAVTVYEREKNIGGLLRYGIPNFKLEKSVIDRRRAVLEAEGIRFVTGIEVGKDVSAAYLRKANDALVLAFGTPAARDLAIPGRDKKGIHLALELLGGQNRALTEGAPLAISAKGKRVLVIGGGDTGSDCVGTSVRHGAASVLQIEIMPRPPEAQSESTPWPQWPYQLRTSSSHKEGCERRWNLSSLKFIGGDAVEGVEVETVHWELSPEGRPLSFKPVPGTTEIIPCDLVFLAMGFIGVQPDHPILTELGLQRTPRGAIVPDEERGIFVAGDTASGASLVVRAITSGRDLAKRLNV